MSPIIVIRKNTKLWIRGIIATTINGFASGFVLIVADPKAFNFDEGLRKLMLTSAVFALFGLANYLKQHPLPDDDPEVVSVTSTRMVPMWLLPLLLVSSLAAGASSCASAGGVVKPNPTVEDVQAVRNQSALIATATKNAAAIARRERNNAQALYDAKVISAAVMQRINSAGNQADIKGHAFIDFAETVTTDASLRTTSAALLDVFKEFIDSLGGAGISGDEIRKALAVLFAYLGVQ